jgi:hypothetical protein
MLYAGKRPEEMDAEELQAAEACVLEGMRNANQVYELNRAGFLELCEEQSRRHIAAGKLN